ncbi:phosphatidylinositol N-acetylglucosaminyltransferase subunit Q isoform X3 [Scleropages formosus]|nr:phosphatidylinositol N-acetylglucosaminyltransferase subunit Q isoform X3 [Scleropages formosus]
MQSAIQLELTVLGSWSMPKDGQEGMDSFLKDLSTIFPQGRWLQLSRELGKRGFACQVIGRDAAVPPRGQPKEGGDDEKEKVIFIHYDQRKVMLSHLHPAHGQEPAAEGVSELRLVFQTVAQSQPLFFLDKYDDGPIKLTHWQSEGREASILVELIKQASVPMCLVLTWLLSLWTQLRSIRVLNMWPVRFVSSKLSTCVQLSHRTEHLQTISSPRRAQQHADFMRKANIFVSFLVDIALGLLLISWLYRENRIGRLANTLVPVADHVAKELQELLQWLMGAPAGLKMNRALDQVLGRFFLYHIHLWINDSLVCGPLRLPGADLCPLCGVRHRRFAHLPHLLLLRVRSQDLLSEDLRALLSVASLQREEVERVTAACRLLLIRPGSALHRDAALHHPAVPAAHHCSLLPGLHPAASGSGALAGLHSPYDRHHQLLPPVRWWPAALSALPASRGGEVQGALRGARHVAPPHDGDKPSEAEHSGAAVPDPNLQLLSERLLGSSLQEAFCGGSYLSLDTPAQGLQRGLSLTGLNLHWDWAK